MSEKIPLGELISALSKSTGFEEWFKKNYTCNCDKRRALFNYIKVLGPKQLADWIRTNANS